jgi:hypothetical protein
MDEVKERLEAMHRYLAGEKVTYICSSLKHSRDWFYYWQNRFNEFGTAGLTNSKDKIPHNKTSLEMEQMIIKMRRTLERSKYMLIGAPTIQRELIELGFKNVPPIRTIEEILKRNNLTYFKTKLKENFKLKDYPKPNCKTCNDIFEFDLIGPKYLKGSKQKYYYYNLKDVFSLAIFIDAFDTKKSLIILDFLVSAFQELGIPIVLQLDNALEFRGSNRYPRSFSKVIRLCLFLGIEVVFIPKKMPRYNGSIENSNGFVDREFIEIQELKSLKHIKNELKKLRNTANKRHPHESLGYKTSAEIRKNFKFRKLPKNFKEHKEKIPIFPGKISFIRLVKKNGRINIFSEKFYVGRGKKYEFVKATIFTKQQKLKVYFKGKIIKVFDYKLPV